MKIQIKPPVFKPVVITLENVDEITWLRIVAKAAYNSASGAEEDFFDSLQTGLEDTQK